jgi:hypothetical protein
LEVRVAPKKDNRPTDLKNFIQAVGHVPRPRYVNLRDGVALEFLPTGRIYSISFFPPERERGLRCSGFPPYDAGLTQYRPDESFGEIPISDQDAILDNFAFQFNGDASTKAYIIVYAGLRSRSTEALVVGNRIRNYLNAKRQIQMERLILVNGGYREMLEVELFAIPATMPKPTPRPTVPASDIRIIEQLK